jgi:hypothetical protein
LKFCWCFQKKVNWEKTIHLIIAPLIVLKYSGHAM